MWQGFEGNSKFLSTLFFLKKFFDFYKNYFIFHLDKNAKDVKKLDFKFDTAKTLQSKFRIIDGTFEKQK